MDASLTSLKEEFEKFKSLPRDFQKSGYSIEIFDEKSFSIKSPNAHGDFNSEKKYQYFISALLHGNETGGVQLINHFCTEILKNKNTNFHSYIFCLGNLEAGWKNVRFLERDLNRSFLAPTHTKLEEKLALEIGKLAAQCAFSIDLHQTNRDSVTPFMIFVYSKDRMGWARFLDPEVPIITSIKERHKDGSTLDMFCFKNGTINVTIESGICGFHQKQLDFGLNCLRRTLVSKVKLPEESWENTYKVVETIYWETERLVLKPGYYNFSTIHKDEAMGEINGKEYLAPYEGAILFPKYGEIAKNTKEVFTVAVPISGLQDLE